MAPALALPTALWLIATGEITRGVILAAYGVLVISMVRITSYNVCYTKLLRVASNSIVANSTTGGDCALYIDTGPWAATFADAGHNIV